MLLVYIYLPQRRKRQRTEKTNNADPSEIPMVDLMDKAGSSNVKTNANLDHSDCVDQKFNSFEFHRADDANDND